MSKCIFALITSTCFSSFVISDTQKNESSIRESDMGRYDPMKCFSSCLVQKRCGFAISKKTGCVLYGEELLDLRKNECAEIQLKKSLLPSALAGACADHNCGIEEICQPLTVGGFQCVTVQHGSPCVRDTDCGRHFMCRMNKCLCKGGFHYHPKRDKCTRGCDTPGYGFDAFPELTIRGHNDVKLYGINYTTCLSRCVEYGVACKTIDWSPQLKGIDANYKGRLHCKGQCLISESSFFRVASWDRITHDEGWLLLVRRCL